MDLESRSRKFYTGGKEVQAHIFLLKYVKFPGVNKLSTKSNLLCYYLFQENKDIFGIYETKKNKYRKRATVTVAYCT